MPVPVRPSQPHADRPRPEPNNKIHVNFINFSRYLKENMVRVVQKDQQVNPLTPNDPYSGRTAPLTCIVAFYIFIQQI